MGETVNVIVQFYAELLPVMKAKAAKIAIMIVIMMTFRQVINDIITAYGGTDTAEGSKYIVKIIFFVVVLALWDVV